MMPNQRYRFVPPGGDHTSPILIVGLQDYSPGQQHKVDVWRFEVPAAYQDALPDGTECDSYAAACGLVARVYFDGDVAKTLGAIRP
jgi:hypothetical protein